MKVCESVDYIEREKVYEMLNALGGCGAETESWADGWDKAIDTAIDELNKIPAADVRSERHGVWLPLETTNGKYGKKVFKCSECNTFHFSSEFCPKCGALMDADKKDIGTHDEAVGYAPNGEWCGECLETSCINCSVWRRMKAAEGKIKEGEDEHSTYNAETS